MIQRDLAVYVMPIVIASNRQLKLGELSAVS